MRFYGCFNGVLQSNCEVATPMWFGLHRHFDQQMGVIAVFGQARSTFAVACARIMAIDGVLNRGKYLLLFKLQVRREFNSACGI
tara:strand:+ start:73 stop:324 length:252 start_codon:yes stop_codon:yes gene_type:complete